MEESRNWEDVSEDIEKIHKLRKKTTTEDKTGSSHACKGFDLLFDSLGAFGLSSMINRKLIESKERRENGKK